MKYEPIMRCCIGEVMEIVSVANLDYVSDEFCRISRGDLSGLRITDQMQE